MAYKIDRRVEKTKKLLKESLLKMLMDCSLTELSIKDLCEVAGVNRTTFYKHYHSQFELLKEMENDFFQDIENRFFKAYHSVTPNDGLLNVLTYLKDQRDLCLILMENSTDSDFEERLMSLPALLNRLFPNDASRENFIPQYTFSQLFAIDGAYIAMKRWISGGCIESPEKVSQSIQNATKKIWN